MSPPGSSVSALNSVDALKSASEVALLIASGQKSLGTGDYSAAESWFQRAIALDPSHSAAHNHLGRCRQLSGDALGALPYFQKAIELDPTSVVARRNLAMLLVRLGREEESLPLWHEELRDGGDGLAVVRSLATDAMCDSDLTLAGRYASLAAELRWGRPAHQGEAAAQSKSTNASSSALSVPKLRHDIAQLKYLVEHRLIDTDVTTVIDDYQRVVDRLMLDGTNARAPVGSDEHRMIAHVYNRLLHVVRPGRVERALSNSWDPAAAERQYIENRPGVIVVDDFLSRDALEGVRRFCLESTVWFHNRYAHGRLGAFFQDGFNCPLLLQIAEELREALPNVIGSRFPLRQMWGFKNTQPLPADATTHADFAAVNVNFWITPDDANLDANSGGLEVYDVDAPLHWEFNTYNGRSEIIKPFLEQQGSKAITIPYRQNRAIIFNSDLFHGTAAVSFDPKYENHRINVTMLYGDRENEVHHRELARPSSVGNLGTSAWRPAAFSKFRKARR